LDASKKQLHKRVGQRLQRVVPSSQHPGGHDFIQSPKDEALDETERDVPAEGPFLLTVFDDFADQVQVALELQLVVFPHKPAALAQFHLEHRGQIRIGLKLRQMHANQFGETLPGIAMFLGPVAEFGDDQLHLVFKKTNQEIILVLEVEIDGAISDVGQARDFRHLGIEEALLGKDLYGRVQNALTFVGIVFVG